MPLRQNPIKNPLPSPPPPLPIFSFIALEINCSHNAIRKITIFTLISENFLQMALLKQTTTPNTCMSIQSTQKWCHYKHLRTSKLSKMSLGYMQEFNLSPVSIITKTTFVRIWVLYPRQVCCTKGILI